MIETPAPKVLLFSVDRSHHVPELGRVQASEPHRSPTFRYCISSPNDVHYRCRDSFCVCASQKTQTGLALKIADLTSDFLCWPSFSQNLMQQALCILLVGGPF